MYNDDPEYIIKVKCWTIKEIIKMVDTIKEKHPNAKIRVEAEI